jgi:hypothetical protein
MEQKLAEMVKAIQSKAAELGLVFVSGPDPTPHRWPEGQFCAVNISATGHQMRGTISFAVAERS